jgi:hypothetical protein
MWTHARVIHISVHRIVNRLREWRVRSARGWTTASCRGEISRQHSGFSSLTHRGACLALRTGERIAHGVASDLLKLSIRHPY